jgi:predicted O-methyltransferase YrrM
MSRDRWAAVDRYVADLLLPADPMLEAALAANAAAGLPAHDVSPAQGRLLELLARMCGARRVLEVGTLGAYSTIWLARALPPGGRVVTLEREPRYADVARENLVRAGLDAVVEVRVGRRSRRFERSRPRAARRSTSSSSTPTSRAPASTCAGRSS